MWTLVAALSLLASSTELPPPSTSPPASAAGPVHLAQWLDPADEAAANERSSAMAEERETVAAKDTGFQWLAPKRLVAAAVIGLPTLAMAAAAPYLLSFGLISPVFPLIAVLLPGLVAGTASLLVIPPQYFWIPTLAGSLGALGGLFLGALAGFGALGVVPADVAPNDRNAIVFLPTMAVVTALFAGSFAASAGYFAAQPLQE